MEQVTHLTAFIASFAFIYLKAWQQINVIHLRYKFVPLVSMLLAFCEVITIGLIVKDFWTFIPIGLGGSAGCLLSMWFHNRNTR